MYSGNTFESAFHEQRIAEEPGFAFIEERGHSHVYPHKQGMEYNAHPMTGHFLTEELERLHMAYGSDNLFDRNYSFLREVRTWWRSF